MPAYTDSPSIPNTFPSCVFLPLPKLNHPKEQTRTVVTQGSAVLQLLSGEDQSLLVWGDALLVLDLRLDIVDRVRGLDLEGDGLSRKAV